MPGTDARNGCQKRMPEMDDRRDKYMKLPADYPEIMEPSREQYQESELDYISIKAISGRTELWESKFGGHPYLPKTQHYPNGADGHPLQLLAQLNFAEMPKLAGYPKQGILQFYLSPFDSDHHQFGYLFDENDEYDADRNFSNMSNQKYFRVIYHEQITQDKNELATTFPSFSDGYLPIVQEAKLSFVKQVGYVTNDDYRFESVYGSAALSYFEALGDTEFQAANQYHRHVYPKGQGWVGGYAVFTQGDPRELRPKEDWILLLEIDSSNENGVHIMWGDSGVGTFFIKREDLHQMDFSNVLYYWDNH